MKKTNLISLLLFSILIFPFFIKANEPLEEYEEGLTAEQIADYSDYDQLVRALLAIEEEIGLDIILTRNAPILNTVDSISKSLYRDLERLSTELIMEEKETLESLDKSPAEEETRANVINESRKKFEDIEAKITKIEKMLTDLERRKKYLFNPPSPRRTSSLGRGKSTARKREKKVKNSTIFAFAEDLSNMPSRKKPPKLSQDTKLSPIEAKRAAKKKKKKQKLQQIVISKTRIRKR